MPILPSINTKRKLIDSSFEYPKRIYTGSGQQRDLTELFLLLKPSQYNFLSKVGSGDVESTLEVILDAFFDHFCERQGGQLFWDLEKFKPLYEDVVTTFDNNRNFVEFFQKKVSDQAAWREAWMKYVKLQQEQ